MSNESKSWVYLIFLSAIWGSSFILMKKAMFTDDHALIFSNTQVASMRVFIASAVLLPFAIRAVRKISSKKEFMLLALVGSCGNFFPAFLFTFAETGLSSGYAGMLNSFTPIFALVIGFVVFRERLTGLQMIGVGIGTVGVVLLMLAGQNLSMTGGWIHIIAIVIATLCYAISLNTIKYTLQKFRSIEITSLSFLILLLPSAIIAWQQGSIERIKTNPHAMDGLMYITILSIVGTAFAVIVFNKLVTMSSVLFTSSVTYLIPIFAVIIGLYFKEEISTNQIGAMCVVFLGIFTANVLSRFKKKPVKP
ncbi:MAG: DMT family transporter [Crocinitomicaceae bacterium]|nr:DMT family transporter [Crocinitomicaceae bacterium]